MKARTKATRGELATEVAHLVQPKFSPDAAAIKRAIQTLC